ncbi:MAG: LysE family translocator [Oceanospirillaceae bacterium]|nr:LysE family translocator [Oceanospirillaceae bacterium]
MGIEQILIVAGITWLAVISPGADFAVVSRNSSNYGRGAGIASSAGIASGCWVHIGYAIFGISLIMRFFPSLFAVIQVCGAAYLVYLGLATIISGQKKVVNSDQNITVSLWRYFSTGLLTNSLNPKTSIFVISLYTQLIGPQTSMYEQLLWGIFISLSHFLWFSIIAFFMSTSKIRRWIMHHQWQFNFVIGLLLIALGLALFFTDNLGVA